MPKVQSINSQNMTRFRPTKRAREVDDLLVDLSDLYICWFKWSMIIVPPFPRSITRFPFLWTSIWKKNPKRLMRFRYGLIHLLREEEQLLKSDRLRSKRSRYCMIAHWYVFRHLSCKQLQTVIFNRGESPIITRNKIWVQQLAEYFGSVEIGLLAAVQQPIRPHTAGKIQKKNQIEELRSPPLD